MFQSLEVHISTRNAQAFQTVGKADLMEELFFCAAGCGGQVRPAALPMPPLQLSSDVLCLVPVTRALTRSPPLDPPATIVGV